VGQVLDFSRRTPIETQVVNLRPFIKETARILERTIPESISLLLDMTGEDCIVSADPTRIQQVLLNLVVNARDAMPQGGDLHIGLERLTVAPGEGPVMGMAPGDWVCLRVSDTGMGMSEQVQEHLFEPFFTTKAPGEGTGLGLAQVYGIVTQHQGIIDVETELGAGTTVRVYLPAFAMAEDVPIAADDGEVPLPQGRGETILLVEDEAAIRDVGQGVLESLGYHVLVAENGHQALDVVGAADGKIDLLLTDVVMPEMGGTDLIRRLRQVIPGIRALAMTGYVVQRDLEALRAAGFIDVIDKPFGVDILARTVRKALDEDAYEEQS
jgi:CheY-like chemotaxis protein